MWTSRPAERLAADIDVVARSRWVVDADNPVLVRVSLVRFLWRVRVPPSSHCGSPILAVPSDMEGTSCSSVRIQSWNRYQTYAEFRCTVYAGNFALFQFQQIRGNHRKEELHSSPRTLRATHQTKSLARPTTNNPTFRISTNKIDPNTYKVQIPH